MKKEEEILLKILDDTKSNKLHWYSPKEGNYFYATIRKITNNTTVDVVFKASDNYTEEDFTLIDYYMFIDIFLRKNKKEELKVTRFRGDQTLISEIMESILKNYKTLGDKK